ncbi:MAG TPA: winged helix-turn-helix domain-containing protein [Acetobacteraceae bacterium]|nr:winged helix-turn-helix domain-containing protein [Acetobacteraceae bacterium]
MPQSALNFGRFHLDLDRRQLFREQQPVRLGSRALEILCVLAESQGGLVTKDELMAKVWPSVIVEENNLQVHISALRKTLDADGGESAIVTVPGRGYRLIGFECCSAVVPEPAVPRGNLPSLASPLIGREREAAEIEALLGTHRLVTLVGTGGIGKTSLSLHIGANLRTRFPDGVWLLELAPLVDPRSVAESLGALFALPIEAGRHVRDAVAAYLRSKRLLLILDNCEHVVEHAAALAHTMLQACPGVSLLASSREALAVQGEHVYQVPLLDVPSSASGLTAAQAMQHSAVQLFAERAASALGSFQVTDGNAPVIADICRRLDGIPLAIELAAPRLKVLKPEDLLARFDAPLRLLTAGSRTASPRQQTLRATIAWSYALLAESERTLLRRLGVFPGSFTLQGATAVASDDVLPEDDVLDALVGLVDKSLVLPLGGERQNRYRLLESTRAFALEKLVGSGEPELPRRFCAYMKDVFRYAYEQWPTTPTGEWLSLYEPELESLRAALGWSLGPDGDTAIGLELAGYSDRLWRELSLLPEQRRWFELALTFLPQETPPDVEARIQLALGWAWFPGDLGRQKHNRRAIELLRDCPGQPSMLARALSQAGRLLTRLGSEEALGYHKEALAILRPLARTKQLAIALHNCAMSQAQSGQLDEARSALEQALALATALGDISTRDVCQVTSACVPAFAGNMSGAIAQVKKGIEACRRDGNLRSLFVGLQWLTSYLLLDDRIDDVSPVAHEAFELSRTLINLNFAESLDQFALIAALRSDFPMAARLAGRADACGRRMLRLATMVRTKLMKALRAAMSEDQLQRFMAEGASWSEQEAIAAVHGI